MKKKDIKGIHIWLYCKIDEQLICTLKNGIINKKIYRKVFKKEKALNSIFNNLNFLLSWTAKGAAIKWE